MIVQFVDFVLGCVYLNGELKMYHHVRLPALRARVITGVGKEPGYEVATRAWLLKSNFRVYISTEESTGAGCTKDG